MSEQQPPKIEFPCPDYPIKVIGVNSTDFRDYVIETVLKYAPDLDVASVTVQDSKKGTFQSVRFCITATGVEQLEQMHQDLKSSGRVKMVM
uniref:YbeD family protein n=1 Tax=Marinobacterium profundum TaxID=1714300 RepID=UPI00083483F4|nr:DUF493 family protein [Marinobacterium profundum]